MKKVAVIGHFAYGIADQCGQIVKTKMLSGALEDHYGSDQIMRFDTYGGIKTLFKAPFFVLRSLKNAENVMILPGHNGLRVNAPLLSLARRFFRGRKIHYVVIGGWLPEFLENRKILANFLKRFDGIYVETNNMKQALEAQGFANVLVLPNSKKLEVFPEEKLSYPEKEPYRLCTFSRVMREKGIEEAVNAVKNVNKELGRVAYTLDIYGQIHSSQTDWFEAYRKTLPEEARYAGIVPFDKSVETLKDYFALLFPTYYEGEGFAGTIIDAYSAGLPVIASDWRYNGELVKEETGFLFPVHNQKAFEDILKQCAEDPTRILSKKKNCLEEAKKYSIENVVKILIESFEFDR